MDTGTVTVKLFAALRDAAGTGEVILDAPTSVAAIRESLAARFGPRFAQRLRIAAVMVDGQPTNPDDDTPLSPGTDVALLPPFAGG